MFRQKLDYIAHWLWSHSRHGTHSPFVYRLVDEVLYNYHAVVLDRVNGIRPAKVNALINRILGFWLNDDAEKRDYVLMKPEPDYWTAFIQLLPKVHPGTLLIFQKIYQSKANKVAWRKIIQHEQVTVAIDLYYIGLVFFREGQAKESFKIRF